MAILKDMLPLLIKNGFDLSSAKALEIFGGDGTMHTKDYADSVKSLDIWEYDPELKISLKLNVPKANVTICDSYLTNVKSFITLLIRCT